MQKARERGYAADLEEYRKGVRALAALVFRGSRACGAVSIFGLAGSMEDQRLPDMITHMKDAARSISRKLDAHGRGPGRSG